MPQEAAGSGRLFIVTTSDGEPLDSSERIEAIQFRPGRLLAPFLSGKWRQTAWVSVSALTYNPKTQAVEKRLVRYFAYQWRVRARSGTFLQPYRIQTLLKAVNLDLDSGNPKRTMQRLEKALERLWADKVIATWQYEDWDEAIYVKLRKGWAQHWLGWSIVVEPPDEIRDLYKTVLSKSPRRAPLRESIARARPRTSSRAWVHRPHGG